MEIRVRHYSAEICDLFEAILEEHDISIPDDARIGDESEAKIYGGTYGNLLDDVTSTIRRLIKEVKDNPDAKIDYYDF